MFQRILITGATGMLGSRVSSLLAGDQGLSIFNLVRRHVDYLKGIEIRADLEDGQAIRGAIEESQPDVVVHCAANVNVEACEENKQEAYLLHVEVVRRIVEYCGEKTRIIHVSTDSVYDGLKGNYLESDEPNPINYYAKTKLLGEQRALLTPRALVLRTNIYGFHIHQGHSLVEWALDRFSKGESINGFQDVIFNPVYVGQLAGLIRTLMFRYEVTGILHVGCKLRVSKFDFLKRVALAFGYDTLLVRSSTLEQSRSKVRRPKDTSLDIRKLESLALPPPTLEEGIRTLKQDYYAHFSREHAP